MESNQSRQPWNKGKLVGQKPPLKPKGIWAIRIHLQNEHRIHELAVVRHSVALCSVRSPSPHTPN